MPKPKTKYARQIAGGLGNQSGTRPLRLRVPKEELLGLIHEMHKLGLGSWSMSKVLGYSQDMIRKYQRMLSLPRHTYTTTTQAIIDRMPTELAARCLRVKIKSDIAHERSWNRLENGDAEVSRHYLMDDTPDLGHAQGSRVATISDTKASL
jgi:hypothetical protein